MSSGEEDFDGDHGNTTHAHSTGGNLSFDDAKSKKRRVQRACDICRKKKIRCDGAQMPNNRCTNCMAYSFDCTYVEAAKKRGPPKGYVESLENRLEKMEKLLQKLCPDAEFVEELGVPIDRESWASGVASPEASLPASRRVTTGGLRSIPAKVTNPEDGDASEPEEEGSFTYFNIGENLSRAGISNIDSRFYGKSSEACLIQSAFELKRLYKGSWDRQGGSDGRLPANHRPEFWSVSPWELQFAREEAAKEVNYHWPPTDLIPQLVDLYFRHVNVFFPLLHRPTFDAHLRDGLHRQDIGFGSVLMLVCAAGARWSDDRRVLADPSSQHSAGWMYFQQVYLFRKSLIELPTLFDLQMHFLAAFCLMGSSIPYSAWIVVGHGLRLAQDVGVHRRKMPTKSIKPEDELWKRAFWCLICIDRISSSLLGRSCALHDDEFDLDMPQEVDDEFWSDSDPEKAFKQPPEKPSIVASFIRFLDLVRIMTFANRTIYCVNKSKMWLGFVGPQWEQHIVAELDSDLNRFISSVPDHLRWDPNNPNPVFFAQSAAIYSLYYHVQILIHRPFIPTPKKPSPISFPSLAICANAARSCSHVMDIYRRKSDCLAPWALTGAFTSGVVTLLNLWGVAQTGSLSAEYMAQLSDIHKCMKVLAKVENTWHIAGRLLDILRELASVGDFPLPHPSPSGGSHKRERESDPESPTIGLPPPQLVGTRLITGRSVPRSQARQPSLPHHQVQASQQLVESHVGAPVLFSPEYVFGPVESPDTTMTQGMRWFQNRPTSNLNIQGPQPAAPPTPEGYPDIFSGGSSQHVVYPTPPSTTYPQQQLLPAVSGMYGGADRVVLTGMEGGNLANEPFLNEGGDMWSSAPHNFEVTDWGHYLSQSRSSFPPTPRPQNDGRGH